MILELIIFSFLLHLPACITILKYKLIYKEKVAVKFIPFLGIVGLNFYNLYKHKDFLYFGRNLKRNNPNVKVIATNIYFKPILIFVDP